MRRRPDWADLWLLWADEIGGHRLTRRRVAVMLELDIRQMFASFY